MFDLTLSCLVFVLLFGSAFAGSRVLLILPERHRSQGTIEFTQAVSSLLITFTALVLSLLITAVNSDFKKVDTDLRTYASMIIRLGSELADIGPSAVPIQRTLRTYTAAAIASTWPDEQPPPGDVSKVSEGQDFDSIALGDMLHQAETALRRLDVKGAEASKAQAVCLSRVDALLDQRLALVGEAHSSVTPPFFVMMVFWLVIVFVSFGMTAPRNGVSAAFIVMVGLSISGAIFVILELDGPLDGLIKVSSEPLRHALRRLDLALPPSAAP